MRDLPRRYQRSPLGVGERCHGLSVEARLIHYELLHSRSRGSIPGLVLLGRAGLAESIKRPRAMVAAALNMLSESAVIIVDDDAPLIFVPHAVEDDPPANPNVLKAWAAGVIELPPSSGRAAVIEAVAVVLTDERRAEWWRLVATDGDNGSGNGSANGSGNGMRNPLPVPLPQPLPVPSPGPLPLPSRSPDGSRGARGPAKATGLIVSPLEFDRQHGSHVEGFCDFVCFPRGVFDELANRVVHAGAPEDVARRQVVEWGQDVRRRWTGRIPGADAFKFWRNEWETTHGSNAPAKGRDVTAGLRGI